MREAKGYMKAKSLRRSEVMVMCHYGHDLVQSLAMADI